MATVAPERPEILSEPEGLYEVIDGRVVEKPMGVYEVWLARADLRSRKPARHRQLRLAVLSRK